MPAGLPGATLAENQANPDQGRFVIFDPLSGPTNSPFDAKTVVHDAVWGTPEAPVNDPDNISTGGLSTGIGFGGQVISQQDNSSPIGIFKSGFNDNMIPGVVPTYAAPPPAGVVSAHAANSEMMYIGGGRMVVNPDIDDPDQRGRPFVPDPYTAGIAIAGAGADTVTRDGGAGPAFTGFPLMTVTASGNVAAGAAIESGALNVSGGAMVSGQSAHGSVPTPLAAAS